MKDARDLKRIAEIKQLFTKIEIEHTKWVPYADLINVLDPDTDCHTWNILWQSNVIICQWPANFWVINENQDSFKDWGNDYIFAYTAPITVQWWDYGISTVSYYTRKWNK
jgi:hypothetical protein